MTKEDLKELVKQHFNLVEAPKVSEVEESVEEAFATATLEDGTKITNDKGSEFAVGDKVFVEVDGEKDPAPAGDHITESGITITLDDESIITGMKRPDEEGEGSEDLAEDKVEEAMSAVETEETTESEVEEAFEESKEEEMEEEEKMEDMPKLEDMISVIAEVVEEKMAKVEEKMGELEKEVMGMKEKMEAFASEPAETSTTASNFSSVKNAKLSPAEKRYEAMLNKLQTK
jgi:hypothetical protein